MGNGNGLGKLFKEYAGMRWFFGGIIGFAGIIAMGKIALSDVDTLKTDTLSLKNIQTAQHILISKLVDDTEDNEEDLIKLEKEFKEEQKEFKEEVNGKFDRILDAIEDVKNSSP